MERKYSRTTPETRKKMSERLKRFYVLQPETKKERLEKKNRFYLLHPEAREEQSEFMKKVRQEHPEKNPMTNIEIVKKQVESLKRHHVLHPETRKTMSDKNKLFYRLYPEKHSKGMLGKHHTDESKQRTSESNKKFWQEYPEARKVISESRKLWLKLGLEKRVSQNVEVRKKLAKRSINVYIKQGGTSLWSASINSYGNNAAFTRNDIIVNKDDYLYFGINAGSDDVYDWGRLIGQIDYTPVPEPASLALLAFGLAGLGFSRRKKA